MTRWLWLGLACSGSPATAPAPSTGSATRPSTPGTDSAPPGWTTPVGDTAPGADSAGTPTGVWPRSLLYPEAFVGVGQDPPPLASHRPDPFFCDARGLTIEAGGLEVATDLCPYAALEAPLAEGLPAGARLEVIVLTGDLIWIEPAEGHFSLWLGDRPLVELRVPIPSPAGIYREQVTLDAAVEAGTPWHLHCHNHGANTWRLVDVLWTGVENS